MSTVVPTAVAPTSATMGATRSLTFFTDLPRVLAQQALVGQLVDQSVVLAHHIIQTGGDVGGAWVRRRLDRRRHRLVADLDRGPDLRVRHQPARALAVPAQHVAA